MKNEEQNNKRRSRKRKGATIVESTKVALVTALFCIAAPLTIVTPLSPVGITLGILMVYIAGFLLGARHGGYSVLLYLLLGFCGLPVFSGYNAGAGALLGPTGGYLLGYLPCVIIVGMFSGKTGKKADGRKRFLFGMCLGTVTIYLAGTLWFLFGYAKGKTVIYALLQCVLPFVPGDIVKIVVALGLYSPLLRIKRMM